MLLEPRLGARDTRLDKGRIRASALVLEGEGLVEVSLAGLLVRSELVAETEQLRDGSRVNIGETHDSTVGTTAANGRQEEVSEAAKGEEVRSNVRVGTRELGERIGSSSRSDAGKLANGSASELDTADVRVLLSNLDNRVRVEVDAASGTRVVVDHNGDRGALSNIGKELLQGLLAHSTRKVARRNDNGDIGAGISSQLGELDRRPRRVATPGRQQFVTEWHSRSGDNNNALEAGLVKSITRLTDKRCPLLSGEVVSLSHGAVHNRRNALLSKVDDVLAEGRDVCMSATCPLLHIKARRPALFHPLPTAFMENETLLVLC